MDADNAYIASDDDTGDDRTYWWPKCTPNSRNRMAKFSHLSEEKCRELVRDHLMNSRLHASFSWWCWDLSSGRWDRSDYSDPRAQNAGWNRSRAVNMSPRKSLAATLGAIKLPSRCTCEISVSDFLPSNSWKGSLVQFSEIFNRFTSILRQFWWSFQDFSFLSGSFQFGIKNMESLWRSHKDRIIRCLFWCGSPCWVKRQAVSVRTTWNTHLTRWYVNFSRSMHLVLDNGAQGFQGLRILSLTSPVFFSALLLTIEKTILRDRMGIHSLSPLTIELYKISLHYTGNKNPVRPAGNPLPQPTDYKHINTHGDTLPHQMF